MARIRTSRWWIGLTAILATAFLGVVAALVVVGWPRVSEPEPWAWPSATESSPEPTDTGPHHPVPLEARGLTLAVLTSIAEGWVLVEYDTSAGRYGPPMVKVEPEPDVAAPEAELVPGSGEDEWEIPGSRYLYLIDPSGTVYDGGSLGEGSSLRLTAWLPDRRTAILSQPASGGVTLHAYDLPTGILGEALSDADGRPAVWVSPQVTVSPDRASLVVATRSSGGTITLFALDAGGGLSGGAREVPLESVEMAGFIGSSDGTVLVVAEMEPGAEAPAWTIVTYAEPGVSVLPAPSPAPSPTPAPSPAPSPSASVEPGTWERVSHGLPPAETFCVPVAWPAERQLLNACVHDDGTVVLYTLALMTSTFVDVTTFTLPEDGPGTFAFNGDGTRIAVGRRLLNLFGDEVWELSSGVPTPAGFLWSGEFLILSSDVPEPGLGAAELSARDVFDGSLAWVVLAVEGASGFHTVVAAP